MKRPVRKIELRLVILDKDIRTDGTLKKSARVHVSRMFASRSGLTKTTCGLNDKVRWIYPFHFWLYGNGLICPDCREKTDINITEWAWMSEGVPETPTYNMGVN